jgi:hypothetical protein
MAAQRWGKLINNFVDLLLEGSLALDPMAYAAAMQAGYYPDALEDAAITTDRRAVRVAQAAHPAAAPLRLDVQAG